MTVPGGVGSCAALTNVTVAATHRRRGLLTAMLTRDLADSVERGEIVGALIAAEYPIYGRFGYGPAVETRRPRGRRPRSAPGARPTAARWSSSTGHDLRPHRPRTSTTGSRPPRPGPSSAWTTCGTSTSAS